MECPVCNNDTGGRDLDLHLTWSCPKRPSHSDPRLFGRLTGSWPEWAKVATFCPEHKQYEAAFHARKRPLIAVMPDCEECRRALKDAVRAHVARTKPQKPRTPPWWYERPGQIESWESRLVLWTASAYGHRPETHRFTGCTDCGYIRTTFSVLPRCPECGRGLRCDVCGAEWGEYESVYHCKGCRKMLTERTRECLSGRGKVA